MAMILGQAAVAAVKDIKITAAEEKKRNNKKIPTTSLQNLSVFFALSIFFSAFKPCF